MAGTPVTTVAGGRENEAGRLPTRLCRFKAPTAAGGGSQRVRRVKKNLPAPPGTEELVNQLQRAGRFQAAQCKKTNHSFQLKNENPWFPFGGSGSNKRVITAAAATVIETLNNTGPGFLVFWERDAVPVQTGQRGRSHKTRSLAPPPCRTPPSIR